MVDVNADVGEGFEHDEALMDVITSANIACGYHAGDDATMRQVCRWAVERGVTIGAQPSYLDRAGFGRRAMDVDADTLGTWLRDQLRALDAAALEVGGKVAYLKPHGALYNRVVTDTDQARVVVEVCGEAGLPVVGLPGSEVLRLASEAGVPGVRELFADRAYDAHGHLVARTTPGSVLTDPDAVAERIDVFVRDGHVQTVDGGWISVEADSICVHGDTPDALVLAERVVDTVVAAGGVVGRAT